MAGKKSSGKSPAGKKRDEQAEKIRSLEKKIEELESRNREAESAAAAGPSIVTGVVGQLIPGLGNLVKVLEQTSPEFRQRIAETDMEIKHRIETGWGEGTRPVGDFGISFRPMKGAKAPAGARAPAGTRHVKVRRVPGESIKIPEKEPVIDVFEENDRISVIAELPGVSEKSIQTGIEDGQLKITAGKHSRSVDLPSKPGRILEQTFKNGILHLTMDKKAAKER